MFGSSVAVDGDTVVVGAPMEASAARGVNDTNVGQADNSTYGAGAAYVFVRKDGAWSQEAYLKADNTTNDLFFGIRMALSENTLAVAANWERSVSAQSGAVYIFVRENGSWRQQAMLKASKAGRSAHFPREALRGSRARVRPHATGVGSRTFGLPSRAWLAVVVCLSCAWPGRSPSRLCGPRRRVGPSTCRIPAAHTVAGSPTRRARWGLLRRSWSGDSAS
jgi:hypothetical protein